MWRIKFINNNNNLELFFGNLDCKLEILNVGIQNLKKVLQSEELGIYF